MSHLSNIDKYHSFCLLLIFFKSFFEGAVICVTLLDRFISDQITSSHETLSSWQMKPIQLLVKFILKSINK